ncbi:MAG: PIG-L family deacetylase [Ignavibacteriae bacterium]|nr:PIG-L family deacetylase [Ignavibacteriota bacterium]
MKSQRSFTIYVNLAFLLLFPIHRVYPQPTNVMDAAELQLALKKLTVLGSALYIAAHPDDENTALLSYLSKGRLIRAAYLSVTRGEGGQNLIGSEQGELLGIIRTQELLAARRIDGAEQFFTRAIDFGYSKSSNEAIRIWNRDEILADMVWIIRKFQPDVIITRFSPTLGGHGHHTASAILTREAFDAAGDPSRFAEQLQYVKVWKPKRLMFNLTRFFNPNIDTTNSLRIDIGAYSPLLGRSFTELSGLSRSMHKSQGFGAAQGRGENINFFQHTAGESARMDFFDGIDIAWSRIKGAEHIGKILEQAYTSYRHEHPAAILPLLLKAFVGMNKLPEHQWLNVKRKELLEVIRSCAGLWMEAIATEYSATPDDEITVNASIVNRSDTPIKLERISYTYGMKDSVLNTPLNYNKSVAVKLTMRLPKDIQLTQPYWLREKPDQGTYRISQRDLMSIPENSPTVAVKFVLLLNSERLTYEAPIQYKWIDPVEGELYRPFEIVPDVAVNLLEKIFIFNNHDEKPISVKLQGGKANVQGHVKLNVPSGWHVEPDSIPFTLINKNDKQIVTFSVKPSSQSTSGTFTFEVETMDGKHSDGIHTIQYDHIPLQTLFPKAEGKLVQIDIKRAKQAIGYIMGSGDEVPAALLQLGYQITLISDEDLVSGDLQNFDAIIAGIRTYNTRQDVRIHQHRLLEYVSNGGTYIVQYVTQQRLESENLGPYSFNVSRDRVSVEDAPVTFYNPNHPLLNYPNTITQVDFQGWIQERGLYFADKWDSSYQTVLSSNDPNEPPKAGGLLVARYGKGYYIYTGYSFFRQLPAGVVGAYRLFVNMIELGATSARSNVR